MIRTLCKLHIRLSYVIDIDWFYYRHMAIVSLCHVNLHHMDNPSLAVRGTLHA